MKGAAARWILKMAKWNKPFKRLWISSQTDKAIKEGFASLKPGQQFDRLYESARAGRKRIDGWTECDACADDQI